MRSPTLLFAAVFCAALCVASAAHAQYTPSAGQNAPARAYDLHKNEETGAVIVREHADKAVAQDSHGNAHGNQYDLAIDGAFEGQTVLILDQVGNTLVNTRAALKMKGLASVVYPRGSTPSPEALKEALAKSCQLWLISTSQPLLNDEHLAVIKQFFDAGHGVYIWGDNDPLYVDANRLASTLVPGLRMEGNRIGEQVLGIADGETKKGLRNGHLITTGLTHLYEGTSIATVQFSPAHGRNGALYDGGPLNATLAPKLPEGFTPVLLGSAGNLVTVAYEKDGKRLLMDGGFTRLAVSWDDAGTARYVKNAAAWLVHAERFSATVATRTEKVKR